MKIGIVLLNYKNYNDTIDCINSLINQNYYNLYICVVDNFSNNDSIKQIKKNVKENSKKVFYIENEENLGFAKGNNVGIRFLKKEKKCDYIFVLNTDTIISDKDFFNKFIDDVKKIDAKVALINPMCYGLNNNYMYPSFKCANSIAEFMKGMKKRYIIYFIKSLFNINRVNKRIINVDMLKELDNYNYVIQGCSYFLTPTFFKYYDGLFSETFLYCEELALAIYLSNKDLKTINFYNLTLLHKEGGSSVQNGGIIRRMKKFKQMLNSYKYVKEYYKKTNK